MKLGGRAVDAHPQGCHGDCMNVQYPRESVTHSGQAPVCVGGVGCLRRSEPAGFERFDDGGPEREVIFDRFSRGSEGGNRASDSGVGLGLALVDEHMRLHNGRVWVEERRDHRSGARFVVELPVVPLPSEGETAALIDQAALETPDSAAPVPEEEPAT